ncbi:MAG: mechanosensitive ion channel, partial [Chloroflexia bacterium]|nr:mechanosensitive ion channel [Chloroflexia bacterium]
DVVEVDGIIGRVQDIGIRTSRIVTRDNIEMIIPNSKFINDPVINWSLNDAKTRFFVKIGVAYGSDVDLLNKILIDIALDHPLIHKEPKPYVFFRDFGDSSLNFEIAFWTSDTLANEFIKSDLRFEINRKLAENNITIPFPQRDIHIINDGNKIKK